MKLLLDAHLSLRFGHPPKVILLKSFDQTSNTVMRLLQSSVDEKKSKNSLHQPKIVCYK